MLKKQNGQRKAQRILDGYLKLNWYIIWGKYWYIRLNLTPCTNLWYFRWNIINEHGTSHICVVDSERNAVSMTSTVNSYFGSQILSLSTGIVLNNEMDDFSVPSSNTNFTSIPPPAPNNFIRPLKRPMSSMAPTIVLKVYNTNFFQFFLLN